LPTIVLCGGVVCRVVASFGAIVFAVRAGAFFSFSVLPAFPLPTAAFIPVFFVSIVFPAVAIVFATSAATFFGRPRFFAAGGSVTVFVDIARVQLIDVVYR
jgi:hypothetical protein